MNKCLKALLVAALALSSAQIHAHTNKTFLNPRSHGVNLPLEYSSFNELINRKCEDKFGGNFQITGFYQATTNDGDLAKYFLFNNKNPVTIQRSAVAPDTTISTVQDLDLGYLIHDNKSTSAKSATISLDPQQTAWGLRFDYHQDLDKILKGLYLKASLPVVHVENDLKINVVSADSFADNTVGAGTGPTVKATLLNYLNGSFENAATAGGAETNKQSKLANAKILGSQADTGVADIDIAVGYKFLNKECYYAAIALSCIIPTGEEADGVVAFDALVGNGKHFGLGGDLMAQSRVWGDYCHNLKIDLWMKYRFLFENSEKRTLGLKTGGVSRNWGQYYQLVKAGTADVTTGTALTPAANVTTLNVNVTPGSQFDGVLGLSYNNEGFTFNFGYNMYFREEEDVEIKDTFADNVYAIAARNYDTTKAAAAGSATFPLGAGINDVTDGGTVVPSTVLTVNNLDVESATTPSQFTHSLYGGLGYIFKEWESPLMLGIGGKYEWPTTNAAFEQWNFWGKIGVGF